MEIQAQPNGAVPHDEDEQAMRWTRATSHKGNVLGSMGIHGQYPCVIPNIKRSKRFSATDGKEQPMTKHTTRGTVNSLWVDDGYGNLKRIGFAQLITRLETGWRNV